MIILNKTSFLDDHRFELVAIAHKDVRRIWDVKGKRLCHPGLDTIDDWTKIFSTVGELFFFYSNVRIRIVFIHQSLVF